MMRSRCSQGSAWMILSQSFEEPEVVRNSGVEWALARVYPGGLGWLVGLGRGGYSRICFAYSMASATSASLPLRSTEPNKSIALISVGTERDVAVRDFADEVRRQDEALAASPLIDAGGSNIFDCRLPEVHDAAVQGAAVGRRDLEDDLARRPWW